MILLTALLAAQLMPAADNYTVSRAAEAGIEVVRLADAAARAEVSIAIGIGNTAYELKVNGKNAFWNPFRSLEEWKAKPTHIGNPFLAPWANRLDADHFYANGRKYSLNPDLKNFRKDGNGLPIHGLLVYSPYWKVTELKADASSARVTSRLEFWKHPDLMAQFPFAHEIEMTHRLSQGVLEVETVVRNLSADTMPVSIGYHPYFRLHDAPRDEWSVHLPVRERVILNNLLVPTGEHGAADVADPLPLKGRQLDDVFTGLERDAAGRAAFSVQGVREKVSVLYGPKYPVAVVYAPPGREFICFEPMSGPTNAFNLAHRGLYQDLQTIAPGGEWRESFWVAASGF